MPVNICIMICIFGKICWSGKETSVIVKFDSVAAGENLNRQAINYCLKIKYVYFFCFRVAKMFLNNFLFYKNHLFLQKANQFGFESVYIGVGQITVLQFIYNLYFI